jgi:hypothetical protein
VTMLDLESLLARHEGVRRFAYDDSAGKPVGPGTTVRRKITVGDRRYFINAALPAEETSYFSELPFTEGRAPPYAPLHGQAPTQYVSTSP